MKVHIVQIDESLHDIARKYNVSVDEIIKNNQHISHARHILPGMKLKLPILSEEVTERLQDNMINVQDYYPTMDDFNKTENDSDLMEVLPKGTQANVQQQPMMDQIFQAPPNQMAQPGQPNPLNVQQQATAQTLQQMPHNQPTNQQYPYYYQMNPGQVPPQYYPYYAYQYQQPQQFQQAQQPFYYAQQPVQQPNYVPNYPYQYVYPSFPPQTQMPPMHQVAQREPNVETVKPQPKEESAPKEQAKLLRIDLRKGNK